MRTVLATLLAPMMAATPAFAGDGSGGASSLLVVGFFGFAALIVAFQFVPAVVLFGALLKGLLSKETPATPKK